MPKTGSLAAVTLPSGQRNTGGARADEEAVLGAGRPAVVVSSMLEMAGDRRGDPRG